MSNFEPNTVFKRYGHTYQVDCLNDGKVRFHNVTDVYDIGQLSLEHLENQYKEGIIYLKVD